MADEKDTSRGRVDTWDDLAETPYAAPDSTPRDATAVTPDAPADHPTWRQMIRGAPGWVWLISCLSLASQCCMVVIVMLLIVALR